MTDRNELERLLEAATGNGKWCQRFIMNGDSSIRTEAGTFVARVSAKEDAALICFLRNNAQHYLSLMDEVERLKTENEAAGRNVAQLQRDGVKFCEALRKCSDLVRRYNGRQTEKLDDIPAIVSRALGETHDR